jgi:hypothetical protein
MGATEFSKAVTSVKITVDSTATIATKEVTGIGLEAPEAADLEAETGSRVSEKLSF